MPSKSDPVFDSKYHKERRRKKERRRNEEKRKSGRKERKRRRMGRRGKNQTNIVGYFSHHPNQS